MLRIKASNRAVHLDLRELRAYRELLFFLVWRDVKVKYKQTFIGVAWAIIPLVVPRPVPGAALVPERATPYPVRVGLVLR